HLPGGSAHLVTNPGCTVGEAPAEPGSLVSGAFAPGAQGEQPGDAQADGGHGQRVLPDELHQSRAGPARLLARLFGDRVPGLLLEALRTQLLAQRLDVAAHTRPGPLDLPLD